MLIPSRKRRGEEVKKPRLEETKTRVSKELIDSIRDTVMLNALKNLMKDLPPGYELEKYLGGGSFGNVWLLIDPSGEQQVVKQIRNEHVRDEFKILQQLKNYCSRYIVCATNIIQKEDYSYIFMEDLSNYITLYNYIQNNKNYLLHVIMRVNDENKIEIENLIQAQIEEYKQISKSLLDGMKLFHELKIIHKDVKPENILINPLNKEIKYIDFGLGCMEGTEKCSKYVNEGTTAYMDPYLSNHIMEDKSYDFNFYVAADEYSLALTMFQLFTENYYANKLANTTFSLRQLTGDRLIEYLNTKERNFYKYNQYYYKLLSSLYHYAPEEMKFIDSYLKR